MANSKSRWWRDLLVIPLIIGLIVAIFTFGLPRIFEKGKAISYQMDGPATYIDKESIGNISVVVNGVPTKNLYSYKVRIWNSGDLPLKNLPVRVLFEIKDANFKIFSISHETNPTHEFGKIDQEDIDYKTKRFTYDLLNPKDQDIITFLTNDSPPLKLYTKLEGLKVKWEKPEDGKKIWDIAGIALAVLASFLSIVLKTYSEYQSKFYEWIKAYLKRKEDSETE